MDSFDLYNISSIVADNTEPIDEFYKKFFKADNPLEFIKKCYSTCKSQTALDTDTKLLIDWLIEFIENVGILNEINVIEKLSNLDNNNEVKENTLKLCKTLPDEGIKNKDVALKLFQALYRTVASKNLSVLLNSEYSNYFFLEIIKKSQIFKEKDNSQVSMYKTFPPNRLDEFLKNLNKYAAETKKEIENMCISDLQFILLYNRNNKKIDYKNPWGNSPFFLEQEQIIGTTNEIPFNDLVHITHIKEFKMMCKTRKDDKLPIKFKGNIGDYFIGLNLIWFSVYSQRKTDNNTNESSERSRYGNIGIKVSFEDLLKKYPKLYALGTRIFTYKGKEHEHIIIMSKDKTIVNLNEMKKYPKIEISEFDVNTILRKDDDGFIWIKTRTPDQWNDYKEDQLHFCILESEFDVDIDKEKDLVYYNHKTFIGNNGNNYHVYCKYGKDCEEKLNATEAEELTEQYIGTLNNVDDSMNDVEIKRRKQDKC